MNGLLTLADQLVDLLVENGTALLAGVSLVLLVGCLAVQGCRHAAERRRLGLMTALAGGAFLLVAVVPLPRLAWDEALSAPPALSTEAPDRTPPTEPLDPAVRIATLLSTIDALVPTVEPPSTAPAQPQPVVATFPWARIAAFTYLGLGALLLLRTALGALRLRWLLRSTRAGPQELARAAGLPSGARLCITDRPLRPFCAGIRRPVVVLPGDLLAPARRAQALAVLRHEAAHLRARDPLAQLLLALLAAPLGLHPLFWWLCRDVRFQSELLADDAAAGFAGAGAYARSLLELAEGTNPAFAAAGTVPVFHRPSEFFRRIQMLLQRQGRLSPAPSRARRALHTLAACTLVAATGSLLGVPLVAQDPTPAPAELRDQNQRLRAELDALRAELQQLRASLDQGTKRDSDATTHELARDFMQDRMGRLGQPGFTSPGADLAPPGTTAETEPTQNPPQSSNPAAPGATPPPAGVPVLRDIPLIRTLFVDTNGDGLPDQNVQAGIPEPNERQPAGASAEATADLATRCLDLQSDLEVAELQAVELTQLAAAGHASSLDAKKAQLHLTNLRRKQAIVQRLIRGEIEATQSELGWLERKKKEADKTERLRLDMQVQRATTRLEVLRSVK